MHYTMGRFAGLHQVSKKTLRHYREIGLLLPDGIDPDNGYAYYGEAQRERLRLILYLRGLGFSLEEIAHLLATEEARWEPSIRRQLLRIRAEKRQISNVERELLALSRRIRETGKTNIERVDEPVFTIDTFTLKEPTYIVGRGARVPYNKPEEKQPLIDGLIDGFFGDDVPSQIADKVHPGMRFGIVGEYDKETGIGTYMMGDQVSHLGEIPEGMRSFTVHPGLYARIIFSAKDKDTLVTSALEEAYSKLYSEWIPSSGYAEKEMLALEVYPEEKFETPANPCMEIWTAIVPKA